MTDRVTTEDIAEVCAVLRDEHNNCECCARSRGECACETARWPEDVALEAADMLERIAAERDELQSDLEHQHDLKLRALARAEKAEAELARERKDAADLAGSAARVEEERDRLAAIVERFTALSVNAEPRYEDANGTYWAKPYEDIKPTRKVYLVDAAEFDKAAEAAAKGVGDGQDLPRH